MVGNRNGKKVWCGGKVVRGKKFKGLYNNKRNETKINKSE